MSLSADPTTGRVSQSVAATVIPILIPTFNAVEHLYRCINALRENTRVLYLLYIADDNSPDRGLQDYLSELEETGQATVFRSSTRRGFAAINNWAMGQIPPSTYVCLLNEDIEPEQPWLVYMLQELEEDPQVGLVGARLIYPQSKGSPWGGTIQHAGVARTDLGYPTHVFRGKKPSYPPAAKRRELNAVTGACMLIRRKLWDLIGGFDEGYEGGQFEDVNFCWTARELGWKIIYQPKATLLHYEHGSGEEWVQLTSAKNCQRLRDKWKGIKGDEYLFG